MNDIEIVARRLREIVPEATLEIAHGQMPEGELEEVMLRFVAWTFPTPTRFSSTKRIAMAWPICTSFAAAWGGTNIGPIAIC